MKTKIIILSSKDNFFTIPLINLISKDEKIDVKKVFFFKGKNSLVKKIKLIFLLNLRDVFKIFLILLNLIFSRKILFKFKSLPNVNSFDLIESINNIDANIVVCLNCPQILTENTIKKIEKPIFNIHPGDLPNFRGVFIPFFLLKKNKNQACITFHKIDKFIDRGQLINKNYISLSKKDNIYSIYEKIFLSKKSVNFIISSIVDHSNVYLKPNYSLGKYYNYPSIIEILKFRLGIS